MCSGDRRDAGTPAGAAADARASASTGADACDGGADAGPVHRLRETCRLCGATRSAGRVVRVLGLTPTPPANAFVAREGGELPRQQAFPLDVYFCHSCTHLQLLDVVRPDVLFRHYVYVSGTSPVMVAHLQEYARWAVEGLALRAGELVLEFGSNDGTLLRAFQERGMRVLGVDPAANIAAAASAAGVETLPDFFCARVAARERRARGAAACVCANHVCAHIDDLAGAVDAVRIMLRPGGAFVFEVGYLLDVYQKSYFDTVYHEHVDFHTVAPLVAFFAARGMRLVQALRVDIQGGALRCVVQKVERVPIDDELLGGGGEEGGGGGGGAPAPPLLRDDGSVRALVAAERAAGLDRASTFVGWSASIDRKGLELSSLLRGLKGAGLRVAAYGAPAKATTLMYHFGIDSSLVEYVMDDNPLKQGLYTPGLHVPVVPPDALLSEDEATRPDYVVVLAWNFARSIIDSHAEFARRGGRWIVPLPDLYVC